MRLASWLQTSAMRKSASLIALPETASDGKIDKDSVSATWNGFWTVRLLKNIELYKHRIKLILTVSKFAMHMIMCFINEFVCMQMRFYAR
jgi:hypothetical protein